MTIILAGFIIWFHCKMLMRFHTCKHSHTHTCPERKLSMCLLSERTVSICRLSGVEVLACSAVQENVVVDGVTDVMVPNQLKIASVCKFVPVLVCPENVRVHLSTQLILTALRRDGFVLL